MTYFSQFAEMQSIGKAGTRRGAIKEVPKIWRVTDEGWAVAVMRHAHSRPHAHIHQGQLFVRYISAAKLGRGEPDGASRHTAGVLLIKKPDKLD